MKPDHMNMVFLYCFKHRIYWLIVHRFVLLFFHEKCSLAKNFALVLNKEKVISFYSGREIRLKGSGVHEKCLQKQPEPSRREVKAKIKLTMEVTSGTSGSCDEKADMIYYDPYKQILGKDEESTVKEFMREVQFCKKLITETNAHLGRDPGQVGLMLSNQISQIFFFNSTLETYSRMND